MPTNLDLATHLFIQVAVILLCCRLVGALLKRLGQTQVVSDMVAGFLLGPSLLGLLFPDALSWLFPRVLTFVGADGNQVTVPHPSLQILYVIGQVGLVCFMFLVGLNFDARILSRHKGQAAQTSIAGIFVPLVLGGAVGWTLVGTGKFFTDDIQPWQGALFVGAALAITAFPMLARIIYDSGLSRTRIGTITLSSAAFDDAVAWILLALVVSTAAGTPATIAIAAGGTVLYLVFMLTVGRRVFKRLEPWGADPARKHAQVLPVAAIALLLCAAFTEEIGVYSVFGAFLAGVVFPKGEFADRVRRWLEPMTSSVLLPLFFIYSGLNTSLKLLLDPMVLGVLGIVIVVAVVAKGGAVYGVSRFYGADRREATSIAALMNARGLMELILLNIGLERGLITGELYTVLALMTIVTTLAASPIYLWAQKRWAGQSSDFSTEIVFDEPGDKTPQATPPPPSPAPAPAPAAATADRV